MYLKNNLINSLTENMQNLQYTFYSKSGQAKSKIYLFNNLR